MSRVTITSTDAGMAVALVGRTPNFDGYLNATKRAGCRYHAETRTQRGRVDHLPTLVADLQGLGFQVEIDPALRPKVEEAVANAGATTQVVDQRFEEIDAYMRKNGEAFFPFQKTGVRWLLSRPNGAVLADDMGLGKTIQAAMAAPVGAAVLVIGPSVAKGVWAGATRRFRPDLTPRVLDGRGRFCWPKPGEVVILNFDCLTGDPEPIDGNKWDTHLPELGTPPGPVFMVVDEAHAVKDYRSKRSKRVGAIANMVRKAGGKTLAMTGTPQVNLAPQELWQIFSIAGVQWEAFGSYHRFKKLYGIDETGAAAATADPEVVHCLRKVMLRRQKGEVLTQLPAKRRENIPVEIDMATAAELSRIAEKAGIDLQMELDEEGLAALMKSDEHFRARRLIAECTIPAMVEEVEAYEDANEPVVVFSAHLAPVELLAQRPGWAKITGEISAEEKTAIAAAFQRGEYKGVAITIRSGGVALTLHRASHAIFVDLDWTPAANTQAEDRLHRIGQENPVLIKRLIPDHPLVERVLELLDKKTRLIESSVEAASVGGDVEPPVAQLAKTDVGALFATTARPEPVGLPHGQLSPVQVLAPLAEPQGIPVDYLRLPDRRQPTKPRPAPEDAGVPYDASGIPDGSYALQGDSQLVFYTFRRAKKGSRWEGWAFLTFQKGPEEVRLGRINPAGFFLGKGLDALNRIKANPREAMARYGHEIGACGMCGLRLTNEESRRMGIGPICASKVGW